MGDGLAAGRRDKCVDTMAGARRGLPRHRLLAALLASTALVTTSLAHAADATWLATPGSSDFKDGANWSTGTVPGSGNTAFFGASSVTSLTNSTLFGFDWSGITLNAGAGNYTITTGGASTIDGTGVSVNGGSLTLQINGYLQFLNNATAGSAAIVSNSNFNGINFFGNSTAGAATITINSNQLIFWENSTAANATVTTRSGAGVVFYDSGSGGNSRQIIDAGGSVDLTNLTGSTTFGSIEGAGLISLGGTSLTVGSNNLSTTFSGVLDGGGVSFTKVGTGTLTLTGSSSTYNGGTTVNGGTLLVNGSLTNSSGVTVNNGATLGGSGTVSGVTINNGGTLAPGDAATTLNVTGGVTFNAGSAYNVFVTPTSATKTAATGAASLSGATLTATFQAGTYLTKHYTILTSSGLGGTTFAAFNTVNLPGSLTAALSYTTTGVSLDLTAQLAAISANGVPSNQQNVATTLNNYFNNGGTLPPGFVTLFGLTGSALNNGLAEVSGESSTATTQAAFNASGQFIDAMMGPHGGDAGSATSGVTAYAAARKVAPKANEAKATEAYAAVTPRDRRADSVARRWGVWASGYGGSSTVSGDAATGASGTTSRTYGTVIGADYQVTPDTLLGFALGGAGFDFSLSNGLGSGRADLFQAGLYGRHTMGAAYLSASLAYGWQDVTTDRTVTVSGIDKLTANYKANTFAARTEAGWRVSPVSGIGVTPYAALQVTSFRLPGYSETAVSGSNQFALSYSAQTTTNARGELGARADKAFPIRDGLFTLRGRAAWVHDSNTDRPATAAFQALPGTAFTVNGARPAANAALVSAGGTMDWLNGFSLAGGFEGEFSSTTRSYAGKATLRYAW
jgi:uncharacterized protein with beta-barrel porin domain